MTQRKVEVGGLLSQPWLNCTEHPQTDCEDTSFILSLEL